MRNSDRARKNRKKKNLLLLPVFLLLLAAAAVQLYRNWMAFRNDTFYEEASFQSEDSYETGVSSSDDEIDIWSIPEPTAEPAPTPTATPEPTPTPKPIYRIPEYSLTGMEPNPDGFHVSEDGADLAAFLDSEEVTEFLKGKTLVWNPERERFPGSQLYWYFDETILCIVWQEVEAEAVGTFSEIIIQDGSQLRRKISADQLWSFAFETTTQFAEDTRAVLAFGGDFYYHGRACGVGIYQREFYRFDPVTCDTCYITTDGDMLFSYRGGFSTQTEAEQFARENDILFSLGFGPVLIDDGIDVTPENYPWGEVNDTYARSALGWMERHHYLTMNINCGQVGTEYYNLATLRQAADAMIAKGCRKAYALAGGQTATTVFGGMLINPVQFGQEKEISDIIYFASALGAESIPQETMVEETVPTESMQAEANDSENNLPEAGQ